MTTPQGTRRLDLPGGYYMETDSNGTTFLRSPSGLNIGFFGGDPSCKDVSAFAAAMAKPTRGVEEVLKQVQYSIALLLDKAPLSGSQHGRLSGLETAEGYLKEALASSPQGEPSEVQKLYGPHVGHPSPRQQAILDEMASHNLYCSKGVGPVSECHICHPNAEGAIERLPMTITAFEPGAGVGFELCGGVLKVWAAQAEGVTSEVGRLRGCLAFFASVIKSGEPWTETCQREYDAALATPVGGKV